MGELGEGEGELDPAAEVEERRRLVEHEHARPLGEGAGDEHPLALPVGEHGEGAIPHRQHAEVGGRGVGDLDVLGGEVTAPAGVRVAAELDDVAHGEQPRVDPIGQHHGDAARPFAAVEVGERRAVEAHHAAPAAAGHR